MASPIQFISFEGIDGSGKSTQAALLAAWLEAQGGEVVRVREPGGTPVGEAIRRLLLDPQEEICARAEALLFSAARAQLVEQVIRPALTRGATVIADRFFDSSSVYQGAGRSLGDLTDLHQFVTGGREPDLTFWIDIPPQVAAARRSERAPDRMEAQDLSFYERLRNEYRRLAQSLPHRVVPLDGQATPGELHRQIVERIGQG